jgi:energy-coupling factor transport system ATP-binding protein
MNKAIEVRDYTFRYPDSEEVVLDHCRFTLAYGEFVLLVGDSGSGKSTLIGAIIGSLTQASEDAQTTGQTIGGSGERTSKKSDVPVEPEGTQPGKIFIGGCDVTNESVSQRAHAVGSVLQEADSQIVHTTVEDEVSFGCENLGIPAPEIEDRAGRACAFWNLDRAWHTAALSGGQKQRLITAAALAMDRKILILDEPLANLDQAGAALLLRTLAQLAKEGYAILLAEHRTDVAAPYADRVVRLMEGKVHEDIEPIAGARGDGKDTMEPVILAPPKTQNEAMPLSSDRTNVSLNQPEVSSDRIAAASGAPLLSAQGISLRLGGREILHDISLAVRRGERIVITGENGSGKTMLLRTLARLQKPSHGKIVFSQSLRPEQAASAVRKENRPRGTGEMPGTRQRRYQRPSPAWFRSVGYVFQNPNYQLFLPSVLEEIAYGAKDEETARRTLELFGLAHLAKRHPHSLSEGQKRLVTIAAIAAQEPEILLLDEPTVGQDHTALARLMTVLGTLNKDRDMAIVMVTHDQRCADFAADQTIRMEAGRAVFQSAL